MEIVQIEEKNNILNLFIIIYLYLGVKMKIIII